MKSGIYTVRNKKNGNRYVGSAVNIKRRWSQHKSALRKGTHKNGHLQRAWNKYSKSAFGFEVLLYCAPEMCVPFEQMAMDTLEPEYNIAPVAGSRLGIPHTTRTKAKISAARKGRIMSAETKAKISASLMGHEVIAETRANMSAWQKGRKKAPLSAEHKANIAAGMLGLKRGPMSAGHKAKLSAVGMGNTNAAANKGKPWSPARRAAQGEHR